MSVNHPFKTNGERGLLVTGIHGVTLPVNLPVP